ncbi:hypothetical protein CASFOL_001890 [Castilleja foliolosa]|uniref:Replication factor A C-terminal domain-containing protein n=1 Tax=Castilleja foliolosa TaxID=1961234 RepID=A0ABD3EGB1_9LAMI
MTYQRVRDIRERQTPGTIEVRVLRKWISKGKKEELCYQFIDNYGDCIEATADVKHIEYFDSVIQLQSCYKVSGYIATGPRTYMATVDHAASLVIGQKARFDPATDQSLPSVYFSFATYETLKGRIKDPRLLTDYIGRVETNCLRTTSTGKTLRKTLLQDELKQRVEITLWPEKIHLIDDKVHPGDIVAVTSTMVTEHNGRLQLESTYLTTAFINPNMPQTIYHINRLNALPAIEPTSINEPTTTLADLKLGSKHTIQNSKNFTCKAKIIHIHENRAWYYVLCSKCSKKLYPQQDNDKLIFVCEDDDNITPNFRYCVNVTIEDTTGCVDTVFFNESIQSILNISCEDMVTKHVETSDPKIVPQLLRCIIDGGENNDGQPAPSNHPGPSDPPGTSDQPNQLVKPIRARRLRKPTRIAKLTLRYPGKVKILFDSRRLMEKFEIFFVDGEKEVEYSQDEVKLQEKFKQKWVNYVGRL